MSSWGEEPPYAGQSGAAGGFSPPGSSPPGGGHPPPQQYSPPQGNPPQGYPPEQYPPPHGYPPPQGQPGYGQPFADPVPPSGYGSSGGYGGPARASFGARLVALLIDGLLASIALMVLILPLVAIGVLLVETEPGTCTNPSTGLGEPCDVPTPGSIGLILALVGVGFILYFVVLFFVLVRPVAKTGQTTGRKVMNIKVVDQTTGGTLSMGKAIGRYLFASFISGFFYIGYLWMLWDENSQTLHDKVVDAVVVPTA